VSVAILKFIGCLMGSQCRLERCELAGRLDWWCATVRAATFWTHCRLARLPADMP